MRQIFLKNAQINFGYPEILLRQRHTLKKETFGTIFYNSNC